MPSLRLAGRGDRGVTKAPETIWATSLDDGIDTGTFCAPRPHMNGGPPNGDAIRYTRTHLFTAMQADRDAAIARAEKAEAACVEWAEVSQRNYQVAKQAVANLDAVLPPPPETP